MIGMSHCVRRRCDDAVDALVYLILGVIGDGIEEPKVHYV